MRQMSQKTRRNYPRIEYAPRPILTVMTAKRVARFLARIDDRAGPFGCWPCRGAPGPFGYRLVQGCDAYQGFSFLAHRVAWTLHNGREPVLDILHACDWPPCCNWRHLREGAAIDNARDMMERGRPTLGSARARGPDANAARYTAADRDTARRLRYVERWPLAEIACELGAHRATIMRWLTD